MRVVRLPPSPTSPHWFQQLRVASWYDLPPELVLYGDGESSANRMAHAGPKPPMLAADGDVAFVPTQTLYHLPS